MIKTIGMIFLVILLLIIFVTPMRDYMNNLVHKENRGEIKEGQVIGTVSGYNPRVKEIQEILKDTGLDPGDIDGLMGVKTRDAVKEFQKAKGLKPTGKIDSVTMLALNRAKEITKSPIKATTKKSDLSLDLNSPKNLPDEHLKPAAEHTRKMSEAQDEVLSYRLKSKDRTKQIQAALKKAGFYKGEIDGKVGLQTKTAIKAFQKSKGLTADGIVGQRTWEETSKYLKN